MRSSTSASSGTKAIALANLEYDARALSKQMAEILALVNAATTVNPNAECQMIDLSAIEEKLEVFDHQYQQTLECLRGGALTQIAPPREYSQAVVRDMMKQTLVAGHRFDQDRCRFVQGLIDERIIRWYTESGESKVLAREEGRA